MMYHDDKQTGHPAREEMINEVNKYRIRYVRCVPRSDLDAPAAPAAPAAILTFFCVLLRSAKHMRYRTADAFN